MKRAFISLYIVIVFAILLVGWGMDKLWEKYQLDAGVKPYEHALLYLLENHIQNLSDADLEKELAHIEQTFSLSLDFYHFDELAQTDLGEKILEGQVVFVRDKDNNEILYKKLNSQDRVLALKQQITEGQNAGLYFVFLILFYLILALVIYFWVWPLSRDLGRLQKQTQLVGKDGAVAQLQLRRGSHVQALADSFNAMSARIRELLASRKEMTYAVSHELRTPLARMKFALEMAKEEPDGEKVKRQIESVREDVNALDRFVSELLTYASFDQHYQELETSEGDFYAFCLAIVEALPHAKAEVKVLKLSDPLRVECDWQLMERVVSNLVLNAQRFAQSCIEIRLERSEQEFVLICEDDGPGIAEEHREKVFQSFVRLANKKEENSQGYGLGLAIVKRIVQWHRGHIHIEKGKAGGARFVMCLPQ